PDWPPAATCLPSARHPRTESPAAATPPVPPDRPAQPLAAAPATAPGSAHWQRHASQQRLRRSVQQDALLHYRRLAGCSQTQCRQSQLVDFAQNALGGLIESLTGGVIEQGLRDAGRLELMRPIGIQFLARKPLQVILHGDALAQCLVHLQRERTAQQRLAD